MLSCTNVGKIICAPYILWWFHKEPLFSIQDKTRRKMSGFLSIKKSKQKKTNKNHQLTRISSWWNDYDAKQLRIKYKPQHTIWARVCVPINIYVRRCFFSSVSEKKYFFVEVSIRISWVCTLYNSMSLLFGRVFCCCPYILCCVFLFLLRSNFALFRMYMCLFTLIFLHRTKQFDGRYESFHTTR